MAKRKKNRSVKVKGSKVRSVSYAEERSPSPKKKKRRGSPINVLYCSSFRYYYDISGEICI